MIDKELLRQIRRIEIRTSHRVDEVFSGRYASAFRGRGMEFEEVRPYQVGDDVRSIDWNVSARTGAPHIKIFREERELSDMLAADLSGSLSFGTHARMKRELIAELGAVMAFSALRNGDRIGLLLFTDRVELFLPPRKGRAHVMRVIRDLLARPVEGRGTDLAGALDHLNRVVRRRSVLLLMSDFLPGAADGDRSRGAAWERALRIARRRHDAICVRVTDPAESQLPAAGIVLMHDPETGRRVLVDTSSRRVRDAFSQRALAREAELASTFARMGADAITVRTDESPARALERFFRAREVRS